MEPEVKRFPYFGPLPGTEPAPGPDLAHPPLNVHPQPILHQPIQVEQDGASEQTNSDWSQTQSMQPLVGAVSRPGLGFVYQAPSGPRPILHQPVGQDGPREDWMSLPQEPPRNCPPGLEYLSMVDQLLIHQKADYWEGFFRGEKANRYKIINNRGQVVYYAKEDLIRNCCGVVVPKALDLTIFDSSQNQVMHLYTPRPDECWCPSLDLEISAPRGNLLGTVRKEFRFCYNTFAVKNAQGDTILRIEAPSADGTCTCDGNVEYRITTPDGFSNIGSISRQWSGFLREWFSDADDFNITFPVDSDVKTKAILLGGLFFIDILLYESGRRQH